MERALLLLVIVCIPTNLSAAAITGLFPVNYEIDNWAADTAVEVYDTSTIWDKINGGAVPYVENGLQEAGFQDYSDGNNIIRVEIYDLTTASGSDTIYDLFFPSEYDTFADLGDKGRLNTSPLADYVIEFKRRQYYSILTCLKNDTMLNAAKNLARLIDQKMVESTLIIPQPVKSLSPGNRGSIFNLHGSLVEIITHRGSAKGQNMMHLVKGFLPGVYFIKLENKEYSLTQKLLIIK